MTTNYNRWAAANYLAQQLLNCGLSLTYLTDVGKYPVNSAKCATLAWFIHSITHDAQRARKLTEWESRLATARLVRSSRQTLPQLITQYNRRRDALVTFLKAE